MENVSDRARPVSSGPQTSAIARAAVFFFFFVFFAVGTAFGIGVFGKPLLHMLAARQWRSAIRSFFRMVAVREPATVGLATRIVAIPMKRTDTKVRDYVTCEEMDCAREPGSDARVRTTRLRSAADDVQRRRTGVRDRLVTQRHVTIGSTSYVQLHGKGRKERSIPLWPKTAQILKEWFREIDAREDAMTFPRVRRAPLTRFAVHLLLRKAVQAASMRCPSLTGKRVSPHVIRHGTAMSLLQAGVDPAVIAVWLGHESFETANVYVHANLAMKEKALAKTQPMDTDPTSILQMRPRTQRTRSLLIRSFVSMVAKMAVADRRQILETARAGSARPTSCCPRFSSPRPSFSVQLLLVSYTNTSESLLHRRVSTYAIDTSLPERRGRSNSYSFRVLLLSKIGRKDHDAD